MCCLRSIPNMWIREWIQTWNWNAIRSSTDWTSFSKNLLKDICSKIFFVPSFDIRFKLSNWILFKWILLWVCVCEYFFAVHKRCDNSCQYRCPNGINLRFSCQWVYVSLCVCGVKIFFSPQHDTLALRCENIVWLLAIEWLAM